MKNIIQIVFVLGLIVLGIFHSRTFSRELPPTAVPKPEMPGTKKLLAERHCGLINKEAFLNYLRPINQAKGWCEIKTDQADKLVLIRSSRLDREDFQEIFLNNQKMNNYFQLPNNPLKLIDDGAQLAIEIPIERIEGDTSDYLKMPYGMLAGLFAKDRSYMLTAQTSGR